MLDAQSLGRIADNLASGLSSGAQRFILLFIIILAGALSYLATGDLIVTLLFIALGPILLLFGLLAPENRPEGWEAIWTFILMLGYLLVTLVLIAVAVYISTSRDKDISTSLNEIWHNKFEEAVHHFDQQVEEVVAQMGNQVDPNALFGAISNRVKSCEDDPNCIGYKEHIVRVARFLDDWEVCRETRCRNSTVIEYFDDRIFEFWGTYRCEVKSLRDQQGFGISLGVRIEDRYESLPRVRDLLVAAGNLGGIENSLRYCAANSA
ncbi:hypothetical protein P775_07970 [Puniceibacterium antarcticum]|uniref:Uncharacterized protein n=1 Tax=Puniceibacterium antarcticum TaxID=1206336 RepID=A0A2G8RGY9_9RHOB|nr:hypothetical protein [Puniceibacterium antarcticum]PIL20753.1 hypothetical protein P775_07970 [Puniceibacterium antarcticum]